MTSTRQSRPPPSWPWHEPEPFCCERTPRISALEADRRDMYADWPLWRIGAAVRADWDWLLERVEDGSLPDLPCRWVSVVDTDCGIIYWLDPDARTRHLVLSRGDFILSGPPTSRANRSRMI